MITLCFMVLIWFFALYHAFKEETSVSPQESEVPNVKSTQTESHEN